MAQTVAHASIQLHNKIDIAGRAGLAARQRAEQADMADSSLSQLRRMVAQRSAVSVGEASMARERSTGYVSDAPVPLY